MPGKKGEIPSHVRIKKFSHPAVDHPSIAILESIEDPRRPSQFFRYPLTSVLFMSLVAVIPFLKNKLINSPMILSIGFLPFPVCLQMRSTHYKKRLQ